MEKFKVGDKVTVKGGGDKIHEVTYVYRDGSVQLDNSGTAVFRPMFLMLANSVCNAVIEKKLPPRGAGVYIEQQGALFAVGPTDDGWSVANYGGEGVNFAHGFKTASEAKSWCASKGYKVEDIILSNSLRSRNAVVQKALNARWRIIYRNLNGPFFPYGKETYSTREEAEKRAEELRKRGKKWGSDASYFVDEVGNSRAANAVVKRALNASRVARNADYDYDEDLGVKSIFKVGKVYRPTSGRRNWLYKVVKRNYQEIYVDPKAPGDKTFGEKYATEKLLIDSVKTLQRHAEIAGDRWGTLTLSAANVVG